MDTPQVQPQIIRNEKGQVIIGVAQDTNKNGTAGRPTKYDQKFIELADKYIEEATQYKNKLMGVEDFANYLGVDDNTVLAWANKKLKDEKGNITKKLARPEFFTAIKKIKAMQKFKLMQDGLYGGKEVNSTMAIFLLKVNHGMIETSHTDITTKGKEIPQPLLGGQSKQSV